MGVLLVRTRAELRNAISSLIATLEEAGVSTSVGFVPTMGALHSGHGSLVRRSAKENAITVVSIFVNPKQFGANEDLAKYPRTLDADLQLCEQAGAQIVYAPSVDDMYPEGFCTQISIAQMDSVLCGAYRPGHFTGVCTVVMLLVNLVRPQRAYFGLKDFQQYTILAKMMTDLEHPTTVVGVPTVRDSDGLALSSRNRYLDPTARQAASQIPAALRAAVELYLQGEHHRGPLLQACMNQLGSNSALEVQYCELRDARNLLEVSSKLESESVLAIAAFVTGADGVKTRLIDNVLLTRDPEHLDSLLQFVQLPTNPV